MIGIMSRGSTNMNWIQTALKQLEQDRERLSYQARVARRNLLKTNPKDKKLQEEVAWAQHAVWKVEQEILKLQEREKEVA